MKINLISVLLIVFFISFIWGILRPIDSSDKNRWNRSGMRLRTDHLTGVQYFETNPGLFGAPSITPRLNPDGTVYNIYKLPKYQKDGCEK